MSPLLCAFKNYTLATTIIDFTDKKKNNQKRKKKVSFGSAGSQLQMTMKLNSAWLNGME